jgi:hypothetical protein
MASQTKLHPTQPRSGVTDFHVFEGRGHSSTIDSRWAEVAEGVLKWLAAEGS